MSDTAAPTPDPQSGSREPPPTEVVEVEPIIDGGEYSTRREEPERFEWAEPPE